MPILNLRVEDVGEVPDVNDSFTRKKEDLIKMMGNMNINVKVDLPQSNQSLYDTSTSHPLNTYSYPKQNTLPISNPYNYYGSNQPHSQFEGEPYEQYIESNYNYIPEYTYIYYQFLSISRRISISRL